MEKKITIIDYGLGNIASVINMIKKVGGIAEVCDCPSKLVDVQKLILPGVGSFDQGMRNLINDGWVEPLTYLVKEKKTPILGICLGMQLMARKSAEGESKGLCWIDADVKQFDIDLKVPHMGWNSVVVNKENVFFSLESENRFYFVHSYFFVCDHKDDILLTTNYGIDFTSAFQVGNVIGMQFHPEKSHKFGMSVFKSFLDM
ncbi:imidazole glycerol phosphate synthase subunit HisH [Vibrio cholerae]|uniref:imidazole glycerol phosphate synthase subunit HisH n=2 Tax=Vibrio cholerae TaxID=666 RepID=UPI00157AD9FE|nr:imidazole glycerol phosphate synthase subunit HisH [Vibrio cholerae]CAB1259795.1 imidazole glycerol phosphate synthase subunit HisH [Vibrio cholerae]